MSVTADELSAFHGTVRHGSVNGAAKTMDVRAATLIERRRSLAAQLDRRLSVGNGPGWKLTADGQQLYDWIDAFPGGVEPAALELSKHGWDAVEPGGATPDAYDDPDATGQPTIAQAPPHSTIDPSRLKVRVELPQHPVLAELVRSAIVTLPAVAGTLQIANGGSWPAAIERLITGDIDVAFGWSPTDDPNGYPPTLTATRLMTDNFDHAIERRGWLHRVWPAWTRAGSAALSKLRKRPAAILGRSVQALLYEHFQWLAGKFQIELDPPSDRPKRNAWVLGSRFSQVVRSGEIIRPVGIFGLRAGFDVACRADEERVDALAIINGMVARFASDTGIDPSPVRSRFIYSPSPQDVENAKAMREHRRARLARWKS